MDSCSFIFLLFKLPLECCRILKRKCRIVATLSTLALSVSLSPAAGIAALKEQSFHSDAAANILAFQNKVDDGSAPFVKLETPKGILSIDRLRIAALVEVPNSIPSNITDEAQLAPLRKSLEELSTFTRRFPKSTPALADSVTVLSNQISNFDDGHRRINGKWLTSQEFAALKEATKNEALHPKDSGLAVVGPVTSEQGASSNPEALASNALPTRITLDGEDYEEVRWKVVSPVQVTMTHRTGVKPFAIADLPPYLQQMFHYSPEMAKNYIEAVRAAELDRVAQKKQREAEQVAMAKQDKENLDQAEIRRIMYERSLGTNYEDDRKPDTRGVEAEIECLESEIAALDRRRGGGGPHVSTYVNGRPTPATAQNESFYHGLEDQVIAKRKLLYAKKNELSRLERPPIRLGADR